MKRIIYGKTTITYFAPANRCIFFLDGKPRKGEQCVTHNTYNKSIMNLFKREYLMLSEEDYDRMCFVV